MPLAGHGLRPTPLRRQVGRPQLKRDPLGGAAQGLPQTPWRHDPDRWGGEPQQVLVATDQYVRVPGHSFGYYSSIGRIEPRDALLRDRLHHSGVVAQVRFEFFDRVSCDPHLPPQHRSYLAQNSLAEHQLMLGEDCLEQISTKATGCHRADDYIGIEEDLHDTSRNTSSSVK